MSRRTKPAKPAKERTNPSPEFLYAHKNRIFGVMMIGWFMSLMDQSIMNIAVPELLEDFETDLRNVTWTVTAYAIVFAILLVGSGRIADQFGRKKVFLTGMFVFTLGSALCATSWEIGWLIGFRAFQAVGAGLLAPLGFAMTMLVFPPEERGRGLATIAVVALVASGIGPVLGGLLIEVASWEWIFLINVPLGIVGIVLGLRWWPETYDLTASRRVDVVGMLLLGAAVFFLTFGLSEGNYRGWDNASVLFFLQLSVFLFVGFWASQRIGKDPMVPPALTRNRQFVSANVAMLLLGAGALGALLIISLVLVNLWGYSELEAALAMLPIGAFGGLAWPVVGKGADHLAPYRLAMPALLLMAAGLIWLSFLPSTYEGQLDYWLVLPGIALIGLGVGVAFPAINVGAMGAAAGPHVGVASGLVNMFRQIGAALGIGLLIMVFTTTAGWHYTWKKDHLEDTAYVWAVPTPVLHGMIGHDLAMFAGAVHREEHAPTGFNRMVRRESAGIARDGYAWALRIAALLLLLALPFARRMTLTPAEVRARVMAMMRAAAAARAAGAAAPLEPALAGAPAGARPDAPAAGTSPLIGKIPPSPAPGGSSVATRIAELEDALRTLREQVGGNGHQRHDDGRGAE
jgi:EmrB/QacA subfamily drug resistance transporter